MNQNERDQIIRKSLAEVFNRVSDNDLLVLFHQLREAYGEKHRGHHTLTHIAEMLREAENFPLYDRRAFKAAVFYHDFVYDPKNYGTTVSNEEASAIACEKILGRYGIRNGLATRAMQLIRMTEKHEVPEDDYEAALFMDIDMAILGSAPERYNRYSKGIAREFVPAVGAQAYFDGRTKFLKGLIGSNKIFKTDYYARLDEQARENATQELEILEHLTRWATPSDMEPLPAHQPA